MIRGIDDTYNFFPKAVAGIDRESLASVLSFYWSIFGKDRVDWFRSISSVELLEDHRMYMEALIGTLRQRIEELQTLSLDDSTVSEHDWQVSVGYDELENSNESEDSGNKADNEDHEGPEDGQASTGREDSNPDNVITESGEDAATSNG